MLCPAKATDFAVGDDAALRNAITNAANGDTITFTSNIALSAALPQVTQSLTINGSNFTLSGENRHRGLVVQSGTVAVNNLAIVGAIAQGGNGGDGGGGGGGGAGLGGALFVASGANVTISDVTFRGNRAQGGNGGEPIFQIDPLGGGGGGGGGMFGGDFRGNGRNGDARAGGAGGRGGGGSGSDRDMRLGLSDATFGGGGGGGSSATFVRDPRFGPVDFGGQGGRGGFGGGGGGGNGPGLGGFGGGQGGGLADAGFGGVSRDFGGGGGAGLGGAIFVQEGGGLTVTGNFDVFENTGEGGRAGKNALDGGDLGSGIFLHGNGMLFLAPAAGQTQTIGDDIADMTGVNDQQFGRSGVHGAGSWTLVKNGNGTTILGGNNRYTGGTVINGGVLQGSPLNLNGNITNNATLLFVGSGTYAGDITGIGTLTEEKTEVLRLTGANSYTGGTTVLGGVLVGNTESLQGQIANFSVIEFDQPNDGTYAGQMSGTGVLTKTGAGTLRLTGTNTYSGGTSVNAGTLRGNTVSLQGNIGISNGASLIFDQAGNGIYAGDLSGGGTFRKEGAGELTLMGTNNTHSGRMEVTGGTLHVGSDVALSTGTLTLDGGALRASETFRRDRPVRIGDLGGTISVDPGKTLTLSFVINQGSSLTKAGDGTLAIVEGNFFDNGSIVINGGTMQATADSISGVANVSFASGPGTSVPRSLIFDQAQDGAIRTTISGDGRLIKTGAGELRLFGENTYSAGTTVSAGRLRGTTDSLQGNIVNNATVIFDQNVDGTYAGAMSGSGRLIKKGTGGSADRHQQRRRRHDGQCRRARCQRHADQQRHRQRRHAERQRQHHRHRDNNGGEIAPGTRSASSPSPAA